MGFRAIGVESETIPEQQQAGFRAINTEVKPEQSSDVDTRIKARGTTVSRLREAYPKEDTIGGRAKGALTLMSAPFDMIEAAVSNPSLYLQKELNPDNPWKANSAIGEIARLAKGAGREALLGITGQKLGEIGDVYKEAGVPEPVANTAGLVSSVLIPSAIIGSANKAVAGVYKATDKGILSAGKLLSKGADDAVKYLGRNVDKAYEPINGITVNSDKLLTAVTKLPNVVVKHIEDEIGAISSLAPTIQNVRKIKTVLGKLKQGAFGKSADIKGTIETGKVNEVYSSLKNIIQESLGGKLSKSAKKLLDADEAATEAFGAAKYIKNLITDPMLNKPTKAGSAARKLITEGDASGRVALETLKKGGKYAKKSINKAVNLLNAYNTTIAANKFIGSVAKTALFAGIVGSVGAKVARKTLGSMDLGGDSTQVQQ